MQINSALCQERGGGAGKGRKRHKRKRCRPEEKRNRFFPRTFKGVNISVFGGEKSEKRIGLEIKAKLERIALSLGHLYSRKREVVKPSGSLFGEL